MIFLKRFLSTFKKRKPFLSLLLPCVFLLKCACAKTDSYDCLEANKTICNLFYFQNSTNFYELRKNFIYPLGVYVIGAEK